ncbi:zinc metalloproteinase-disintegrin-like MTP4 isoform 2-T2 [Anomaloglossus baeobatrachus]|uniref:zinc metalloproteinase-disintegrin-like MTP4 isoform X2 n=1 Tax=Anomaloglossus baeobatrachus TaxID=238106 RepID=UPI003F4FF3EA
MLAAALAVLVLLISHSHGFNDIPEGQKYEVVFPQKVQARHKRDTESEYPDMVQYRLDVNGKPMVLHLEKTEDLISENYTETHFLEDGSPVTTSPKIKDHCLYQGYVKNDSSSQVSLSACNGLSGIIATQENKFLIQPLKMSETGAHAVYEYQDQDTPKTCGVDDKNVNETIMTKIDFSTSSQEKEEFLKARKYIQLYMVADNSMYNRFNRRRNEVRQRIFSIINFVNQAYKPLNIFVALIGLDIWDSRDQIEVVADSGVTLNRFSEWRKTQLLPRKPNDNAQLLTNIDFSGSTVGLAWISTLCSASNSAGIIQDHSTDYIPVAATLAHEMGHNLGMPHDDGSGCYCEASSCIMAASLSYNTPRTFSSCSRQEYQKFILDHMPVCMKDQPSKDEILSTPVCGNKFRENGEDCDCGTVEECTDKCCDAATCKLKERAQCAEGECCSNCQLMSAGTVCRVAKDECDLSDMCDGKSAMCPSDRFRINGTPCKNNEGYCYNGNCPTLRDQCETYWGAGSRASEEFCYQTFQNYCPAPSSSRAQCGVLFCAGGSSRPIVRAGFCGTSQCKNLQPEVFVETGTKCDDDKVCINGRCSEIPAFTESAECAARCPGNSLCDHELQCYCEEGWVYPNCDTRVGNDNAAYIAIGVIIAIVVLVLVVVVLALYNRRSKRRTQRSAGAGSGVTNPTFGIQNRTPLQPNSYPHNPRQYPQRPMYPPQAPAQSQKPQMSHAAGPHPPAQAHKPQFQHAFPQPAAAAPQRPVYAAPQRPMYPPKQPQAFPQPVAAPPYRPMYPPVPPQAGKPNYRR